MSIHYQAMEHLDKAKELLATGGEDQLRYAALELRYAIEHLFYKLIPAFKEELPDDVVEGKVWRPSDIIDMIADIEPRISSDVTISFGFEPSPGMVPKNMIVLGKQSGIGKDLIRKAYHALGHYLHARVDQKPHDPDRLRRKLEKLLPYVERFRGDRVIGSGFARRSTTHCKECGRTIAKRADTIEAHPLVSCPNKACGAIYEVSIEPNNAGAFWKLLEHNIPCKACGSENWFPAHKLERAVQDRANFECVGCKAKYRLEPYVLITPIEPQRPLSESTS